MTSTAPPTLLAGETPDATKWALILSYLPIAARKTVDQPNNSTTLVNDTELFIPLLANALYDFDFMGLQNSPAAAGFKLNFVLPSGATWISGTFTLGSSTGNEQFGIAANAGPNAGITGAAADSRVGYRGLILTSSTPGNLQYQFAQNTTNAGPTNSRAGSWMVARRIG